jgi:hypothetical protein
MFSEPTKEQKNCGEVDNILLEMVELGTYDSFGEDIKNASNFMLSSIQLVELPISYSVVTSTPI